MALIFRLFINTQWRYISVSLNNWWGSFLVRTPHSFGARFACLKNLSPKLHSAIFFRLTFVRLLLAFQGFCSFLCWLQSIFDRISFSRRFVRPAFFRSAVGDTPFATSRLVLSFLTRSLPLPEESFARFLLSHSVLLRAHFARLKNLSPKVHFTIFFVLTFVRLPQRFLDQLFFHRRFVRLSFFRTTVGEARFARLETRGPVFRSPIPLRLASLASRFVRPFLFRSLHSFGGSLHSPQKSFAKPPKIVHK